MRVNADPTPSSDPTLGPKNLENAVSKGWDSVTDLLECINEAYRDITILRDIAVIGLNLENSKVPTFVK